MQANPLPNEDQQITLISVRDGNPSVTPARALVVKPRTIAIAGEPMGAEMPGWSVGQALTMIYASGDRVMRLRGVVRELIDAGRIMVEPVGDVKEGDRRDFRRADVQVPVYAKVVQAADVAEARAQQQATLGGVSRDAFTTQVVNVSGSGVSLMVYDEVSKDDLLDVRLQLDQPRPALLTMIGQVVRADPEDRGKMCAVRFAELSEADQDVIVYTVFSNHFAAEGLAALDDDVDEG